MPWFVTLVCAPAEPAASASAAPINAARQWSSLMVFPRVRCRRGAGGAGTSILELCCPSGGTDPSAAGGQRTEEGEGLTEDCSPDGAKRNGWPKATVPANAETSINVLPGLRGATWRFIRATNVRQSC